MKSPPSWLTRPWPAESREEERFGWVEAAARALRVELKVDGRFGRFERFPGRLGFEKGLLRPKF